MRILLLPIPRLMVVMWGLYIALIAVPAFAQNAVTLAPFARDRAIIDSGAAQGRDGAYVPLSGTAQAGGQVIGQFVDASGRASGWQPVATADAAGNWAGTLGPLSRDAGWVRAQVRLQGAGAQAMSARTISAGHVVAIWGQSELHRAVLPVHAALDAAAPVRSPDTLQITFSKTATDDYGAPASFVHSAINDTTPVSAHMVALSNALSAAAPEDRFHFIFHTRAGTGFQQLLQDENTGRIWADDVRLHRFANLAGTAPGLGWISWYNSDAGLGAQYGQVLATALTARNPDASPFVRHSVPNGSRQNFDHTFADLYGVNMPWAIAGPHRFEMDRFDAPIAANRASVDALFADGVDQGQLRRALEPLTYLNGNPQWRGDYSHPDTVAQPLDGMTRLMLLMGNSILRQLDLVQWPLPEFDHVQLSANSAEIVLWSDAGDITTTRAVQTGRDGHVAGFEINGNVAQNAFLQNGRVVVRPNRAGGTFEAGTRLTFGAGGIGSEFLEDDTRVRQVWRDYPIVDVGQTGLEGIPIKAQTPQSLLGVFAPIDTVRDALPAGNLLNQNVACFAATDRPPGWISVGAGWSMDLDTCTATAGLTAAGALRATLPRGSLQNVPQGRILLTFVPDTTGSDPEILRVVVNGTGTTRTELFAADITLTPNKRMLLELAPIARDNTGLSITLRRRGSPTGAITLGSLGLYLAR